MAKRRTVNLDLEIEDELEKVDNGYINRNFDLLDTEVHNKVNFSDVKDNLTSTDSNKPLSANQGKLLNDRITTEIGKTVLKTDVINNLTSTNTDKPLSANQGKLLNDAINGRAPTPHASSEISYGLGSPSEYGHVKTINNLSNGGRNTSVYYTGEALAGYLGKVLNDKIIALPTVHSGTTAPDNSLGKNGDVYFRY